MKTTQKWMLGAALAVGALGLGSTAAQAAEFGVYVRGPVAYVPPCPGPGYVWTSGYQADGYWVPGRWDFRGERPVVHISHYDGWRGRDDGWRGREDGWREDGRRRDDRRFDRDYDHDRFRR